VGEATQLKAVNRAIEELRVRVGEARLAYGEIPAVQRLVNDVERLRIDARELGAIPAADVGSNEPKISIDDSPLDPSMWGDADDEGVGGYHGAAARRSPGPAARRSPGPAR